MSSAEIKDSIVKAINTLNIVEVKGRENLNHLLGAIVVLEQAAAALDNLARPENKEVAPDA